MTEPIRVLHVFGALDSGGPKSRTARSPEPAATGTTRRHSRARGTSPKVPQRWTARSIHRGCREASPKNTACGTPAIVATVTFITAPFPRVRHPYLMPEISSL